MTDEITQTISTYIATQILKQPKRTLAPDEPLLSNGLVDSFSLVDLSLFIEKKYNVCIDDTELNRQTFDTLAQLVILVKSRM
jgi:acyl carrier protein